MGRRNGRKLVLLAEDHAIVGLDVCDALQNAGYRVVGPLTTSADAMTSIEREPPDLAVLDIMLKDGSSSVLAGELRRLGVPFIVHSGSHSAEPAALSFAGVPWLLKPASSHELVVTLRELSDAAATR